MTKPEKQIGPPVTIEGWLIRVVDDPRHPRTLAKATLVAEKRVEIVATPDGLDFRNTHHAPVNVLEAVLKCGGWKVTRPDRVVR